VLQDPAPDADMIAETEPLSTRAVAQLNR